MSIESKKGLRIFCCRRIWSDLAPQSGGVYDWEERRLGPNGRGREYLGGGGGMKKRPNSKPDGAKLRR